MNHDIFAMAATVSLLLNACVASTQEMTEVVGQETQSSSELQVVSDGTRPIPCERLLQPVGAEPKRQPTARSLRPAQDANAWLVDTTYVLDGGPGKDGIPSVDQPEFGTVEEVDRQTWLTDADLVVGTVIGGEVRAYPHPIMDWHEIVNDQHGAEALAITYCPLTGSALVWNRVIDGQTTTFGVSGLLFNNNLIPYDRASDSNWSQMLAQSIHGKRAGTAAETFPVIEMNWKMWKALFPDARVLTNDTGRDRPYGRYPYGAYKVSDTLLFPTSRDDRRLHRKERVLGVRSGSSSKVWVVADFPAGGTVVEDRVGDAEIVVGGACDGQFATAFLRTLPDGTRLSFRRSEMPLPILFADDEGNEWDLFGRAVRGPRAGQQLVHADSYVAYWFAWSTFFPDPEIASF
ncbi:MAG: DUF3179 domain-containing protein [Candidatus Dadabacteria bacterium]|nr:MAG: DUF3179 domain-containing protein [Candidatus Dadabacteria bacterium]